MEITVVCLGEAGVEATGYSFIHSMFKNYFLSTGVPLQHYVKVEHS